MYGSFDVDAELVVALEPAATGPAEVVPVVALLPDALPAVLPAPLMVDEDDGLALLPDAVVPAAGVPDDVVGTDDGLKEPEEDMPVLPVAELPDVVDGSVAVDDWALANWAKTIIAEASKILRGLIMKTPC